MTQKQVEILKATSNVYVTNCVKQGTPSFATITAKAMPHIFRDL
jgi:hypothetical protein